MYPDLFFPLYWRSSMNTCSDVHVGLPKNFPRAVSETASLFCQWDFSSYICLLVAKIIFYLANVGCWLSSSVHLCFPCSSHIWLGSRLCSCLANLLSASFTPQWPLNDVLWIQDQFNFVTGCSGCCRNSVFSNSSLKMYSHTSFEW